MSNEAGPSGDDTTAAELELTTAGVPYVLPPLVEGAKSLEEFAARSALRPGQVLKSLLLDVDGSRYAMLLVPGDREADFSALRRHFGARSVRLADRDTVESVTGYRIGTVTPLAIRTVGLLVLMEEAALHEPLISIGTGRAGRHVRIDPADLARALGATAGAFSRPAHLRA